MLGLSTENQYPTHPAITVQSSQPNSGDIGNRSLPLEPINSGSVGKFSPPNPKKPDRTDIKEHFLAKFFRFGEISTRSLKSPPNLVRSHWIWQDLIESGEISSNLANFRRYSGKNITEIFLISLLTRRILADFLSWSLIKSIAVL